MKQLQFTDPYAEVIVEELSAGGEIITSKKAIKVMDDENNFQTVGIVSKDYNLIQNSMAKDVADDIFTRSPYDWKSLIDIRGKERLHWDGKRMNHFYITDETIANINGGDIRLGALLRNSYDGSSVFGFELYLCNMKCTNQYISRNQFGYFSIKHTANGQLHFDLEDAVNELSQGAQRAIAVAPKIDALSNLPVEVNSIENVYRNIDFPKSKWGDVIEKLSSEKKTMFGLFQALTFVCTHELSVLPSLKSGNSITNYFLNI